MDRKLLERLFYDGIMPREKCCPEKKDYQDTMKLCDTVEQEFAALLSKDEAKMFQDYKEYASSLTTMENAESFMQGMALGIIPNTEIIRCGNRVFELSVFRRSTGDRSRELFPPHQ